MAKSYNSGVIKVRQKKYAGNLFVDIATEGDFSVQSEFCPSNCAERIKRKTLCLHHMQINLKTAAELSAITGILQSNSRPVRRNSAITINGSTSCRQGG